MHIHRSRFPTVLNSPNLRQKLFPCKRHSGPGQEQPQQFKFFIGEGNPFPVCRCGALLQVDLQPSHSHFLFLLFRGIAAQDRLDAGHHLHHTKGFGQIVVRAQVKAVHLVILRPLGGCHNDGQTGGRRLPPQLFQNGNAVLPRKHNVQQNQLRSFGTQSVKKTGTVCQSPCLKPGGIQRVHHQAADGIIVLYAKNHTVLLSASIKRSPPILPCKPSYLNTIPLPLVSKDQRK